MGLLHAFRAKATGIASHRTVMGALALHTKKAVKRGEPLIEVPISSCLAHSRPCLAGEHSEPLPYCRTGRNPHQVRLEGLLNPRYRTVQGGCGGHQPFGDFADWLRLTSSMLTGLSASTESGGVFTLHPFEAAVALSILEGATLSSPRPHTAQWHYLQTLPLGQFLYQGGDQGRRHHVVATLAADAPQLQVDLFHDAHVCLELIAGNLADTLLRKYDHTDSDEQLAWMAQAALLCMRSRLQYLPVFAKKPAVGSSDACEFYRPFIVPCVDLIRHSFDVEAEVNTKIFVDLGKGCVRAEAFRDIKPGEELFALHPSPDDEELSGMEPSMGLVLRYGIGAFI